MKIKPVDSSMDIYKDPQTGIRYGHCKNGYEIDISSKELRNVGFNIGYGVTKGCLVAYVTATAIYATIKAIKDFIDEHSKIKEPIKDVVESEPETEVEEAAEK